MINLPVYNSYNGETQIALLDNSSIAFMEQMHRDGYCPEDLLSDYDAIFVPMWVLEEVAVSQVRSQYLVDLQASGLPIYKVNEEDYVEFADGKDGNLYHVVRASVSKLGEMLRYLNRNVIKEDILDLEPSAEWIAQMYREWPIQGELMANGKVKKKNAGEISLTILAEVLSWHHPEIRGLTIYTQDSDTRDFLMNAEMELAKIFKGQIPVAVTYKSNDFILFQMYRDNKLTPEQIKTLRKDQRRVVFTQERDDKSVMLLSETLDNDGFMNLILDPNAQIIF